MSAVILLDPPGAGKKTQAVRIGERLSIPVISTGEIFRSNIAEGTEIGKRAKSYMDRGELIPDSVASTMVKAHLPIPDATQDFLLDDHPRNVERARILADFYEELGTHTRVVLEIQVDEDEVITRILKHAEEQHRTGDSEPVIRHRLEIYREQTEPVTSFYADLDLLETTNGFDSINEVGERIFAIFDARLGR